MSEKNSSEFLPPTPTHNAHAIWLTGASGMLGRQIARELTHCGISFIGTDIELDISDERVVMNFMARYRFKWIVNCAAYTAVDKAESEPDIALKVNGAAPGILGKAASRRGANLLHISTDYVFNGQSNHPYRETDATDPVSVYGKTKLAGELALMKACPNAIIVRISWLYGIYGRNFVETMLKPMEEKEEIRVVADQLGVPTYAELLAENVVSLIGQGIEAPGIYHYQDKGRISWYGFAREIQRLGLFHGILSKKCRIMPITTEAYPTAANRPLFSVLDTEKARKKLGFVVKGWKENLESYFEERKEWRR